MSLQLAAASGATSYNVGQVVGAIALAIIIGYFLRTKLPRPRSQGGRALKAVGIAAVLTVVTVVGFATSRPRHHSAVAATPKLPSTSASVASGLEQADYVRRANATCVAEEQGPDALGDGPGDPATATTSDLPRYATYLRAFATVSEHELQALRALPQPKHLTHYVGDAYKNMSKALTAMRRAVQYADAGDLPKFKQAISAFEQYGTKFEAAANAAGISVCAQ